ncbi:barwin-like endoglucanase [Crucibulum laeve]|uniref:Barwin-like endoglucanase n=1 Tax=Crucibulum laeve TaxID=68775 RepID=A0A5C3M0K3_9AGAR|nr:barwin-like endoglucanase [Crucibulum laeve]
MLQFVTLAILALSAVAKPVSTSVEASSAVITGGFASFFSQNGLAGACGAVHRDSDFIAAIDISRYGSATTSPLCGRQVQITNANNGKSVVVTIADACFTCPNANSFDLSTGAFQAIASLADGLVPITWSFL